MHIVVSISDSVERSLIIIGLIKVSLYVILDNGFLYQLVDREGTSGTGITMPP